MADAATAAGQAAPRDQGPRDQARRDLFALLVVVAGILAAMQVASLHVPAYIMPAPAAILAALWELLTQDWGQILVTLLRLALALGFSMLAGTVIGCLMGMLAPIRPYLRSLVVIDTGIPALSWMLIAVFWFKDPEIRIFFILTVILLPFYALSVHDGIKALPKEWAEAVDVFRPTRWQTFRLLVLPHIVPYVLTTTKTVIGYATRMVIFAELIGAAVGIGARMGLAQSTFQMETVLAWTVFLVIFNILVQAGVAAAERRLLRYRAEAEMR
ncbi:MAG: hypothetical protein OHK0024_15080 [Thalassobaculales bacterium]